MLSEEPIASRFLARSEGELTGHGQAVWLAISLLTSALAAAAGGWLSWLGGLNAANCVLAGGSAFGATLVIMIVVIQFLQDHQSSEPGK